MPPPTILTNTQRPIKNIGNLKFVVKKEFKIIAMPVNNAMPAKIYLTGNPTAISVYVAP